MSVRGMRPYNPFQVLCYDQVYRLHEVLQEAVPIHGRGNFPTLDLKLQDLICAVRRQLQSAGIIMKEIRLNGGAASYILGSDNTLTHNSFNDIDLIFGVELKGHSEMLKVKNSVLNSLLDFLPDGVNKEKMSSCSLKEAYVSKMVKVCHDQDRWSLISLTNNKGRNVELKFVASMKRQFEFSVDSFQIILDSLLTFYDVSQQKMSEHWYPTVVAESVYGDFGEALCHLNKKLIATRNPEQIRGGGLLKYCNLLVRDFAPAASIDIKALERYMCSRFFIDFPDINQQRVKLENYLLNHFIGDDHMKYDFLMILYSVVDESTICLMGHERRQTLNLVQSFASKIMVEQEAKAYQKQLEMQQNDVSQHVQAFDTQNTLIIDQVYYGYPVGCGGYNTPFLTSGDLSPASSSSGVTSASPVSCESPASSLSSMTSPPASDPYYTYTYYPSGSNYPASPSTPPSSCPLCPPHLPQHTHSSYSMQCS